MLFVYEQPQPIGIWMKDMRFSLDIIWIRDGRIVHVEKNAPPLVPSGPERVYTATGEAVLEVPAGFADQQKIRVGDRVKVDLTNECRDETAVRAARTPSCRMPGA